jgi:hypothetical protein
MVVCDSNIVIWDEITGTLVKIDAESKRNDIVAGGADLAGLRHIACDGNRAVVLASAGIVDISLSRRSGLRLWKLIRNGCSRNWWDCLTIIFIWSIRGVK